MGYVVFGLMKEYSEIAATPVVADYTVKSIVQTMLYHIWRFYQLFLRGRLIFDGRNVIARIVI